MLRFDQGVIGHRGACRYAPENTLASFEKAHELGIECVEFDVMLPRKQLSEDPIPVVFHDETVDRTTNGHGYLDSFSNDQLSQLDAGFWFGSEFKGERIPLLSDVIRYLLQHDMTANVEIKPLHGNDKEDARLTLEVIKGITSLDNPRIFFSSFSIEAIEYLNEFAPSCYRALLLDEWYDSCIKDAKRLGCVSINTNYLIMTPQRANEIKSAGFNLLCYTVNDADRAEELRSWGVDAVFSDAPDVTRRPEPVRISYCRR
jgi:glycerophosphoryl diester phosphodiesterase